MIREIGEYEAQCDDCKTTAVFKVRKKSWEPIPDVATAAKVLDWHIVKQNRFRRLVCPECKRDRDT